MLWNTEVALDITNANVIRLIIFSFFHWMISLINHPYNVFLKIVMLIYGWKKYKRLNIFYKLYPKKLRWGFKTQFNIWKVHPLFNLPYKWAVDRYTCLQKWCVSSHSFFSIKKFTFKASLLNLDWIKAIKPTSFNSLNSYNIPFKKHEFHIHSNINSDNLFLQSKYRFSKTFNWICPQVFVLSWNVGYKAKTESLHFSFFTIKKLFWVCLF